MQLCLPGSIGCEMFFDLYKLYFTGYKVLVLYVGGRDWCLVLSTAEIYAIMYRIIVKEMQ